MRSLDSPVGLGAHQKTPQGRPAGSGHTSTGWYDAYHDTGFPCPARRPVALGSAEVFWVTRLWYHKA